MLTAFETCQPLLSYHQNEGEEFLHRIVTTDKTLAHAHQSMQYHHKVSLILQHLKFETFEIK